MLLEVEYCHDTYQAAGEVDAIVLLTEWEEFRNVDWSRLATLVERPLIIDGRNALSPEDVASSGLE